MDRTTAGTAIALRIFMMRATKILLLLVLTITLPVSAARLKPTSDLLLPRFEVDSVITTVFSVGNASDKPIEVLATVTTNQGLPARELPFTLQAGEVRTVDLREWLNPVSGDSAAGSVTLRTRSGRRDALWGDWSVTDGAGTVLRGGTLADIDRSGSHSDLCRRHLLRYDAGTEILVWRENAGLLEASLLEEDGNRRIGLPGIQEPLAVADLGLRESAGTLRIDTTEDVYIAGAWCVADACERERTALDVNILLDGRIADEPRGPLVDSGSQLAWTLVVTNTGELAVSGIGIEGLDAACPRQELEAGESMECAADDVALSNPQSVLVMVTGRSTCADVSARTTGYYEGVLVDVYP